MATTTTQSNIPPDDVAAAAGFYLTSTVQPNVISASGHSLPSDDQFIFHFSWLDYGFFIALLSTSLLIGVFFGFFSKHKQNNTTEYILGGRSLKILPVATSMVASLVSLLTNFVSIMCSNYRNYRFDFSFPFFVFGAPDLMSLLLLVIYQAKL